MYGKIQITGKIEIKTGLHIGGSSAFAAIGAVDSPVIRDVKTNVPMLPGSSVKGKLRTLIAREYNDNIFTDVSADDVRIARLFGSSKNKVHKPEDKRKVRGSRIIFSDMFMSNEQELRDAGLQSLTEVKVENSISRTTAVANPRQIERVIRGTEFSIDWIYQVEEESEVEEDFKTLARGMELLEYDYLGGHGSRGYGKVKFKDMEAEAVVGEIDSKLIDKCNEILKGV